MAILVYRDCQDEKETPEDLEFQDWMADQAFQVLFCVNGLFIIIM